MGKTPSKQAVSFAIQSKSRNHTSTTAHQGKSHHTASVNDSSKKVVQAASASGDPCKPATTGKLGANNEERASNYHHHHHQDHAPQLSTTHDEIGEKDKQNYPGNSTAQHHDQLEADDKQ